MGGQVHGRRRKRQTGQTKSMPVERGMDEKATRSAVEAALRAERDQQGGQELSPGVGGKKALKEQLEAMQANLGPRLERGTLSGHRLKRRGASSATDPGQAVPEEALERKARALEQALGLAPRAVEQAWRKTDWTVDELYDAHLPEPRWIVPELLPTGLASLAGRPKLGKSWLALQLAAAVACGQRFLDWAVQDGPVLFIALEDPPRRLRDRLARLRVSRRAAIQFYTDWPPLNPGAGGLEQLQRCVAEWQPRLVVIDTLARAFDRRTAWNSLSEASFALAALLQVAHEHDCCVLTVDHHKKPGVLPDVIDDILGSTGKAAVIDTAWGLYKERDNKGARLDVRGRDIEPHELAIEFDGSGNGWRRLCEAEVDVGTAPLKAGLSAAEQEVYELLEEMGEADAGKLAKGLSRHRTSVLKTLKRLRAQGCVEAREVATHNRGGRKILFRIGEEGAAKPSLPTG
jgi:hypothetical protein